MEGISARDSFQAGAVEQENRIIKYVESLEKTELIKWK